MAICEQCGKEHEGTFGSGRFCCRSCSNKWVALNQSDEAKSRKIKIGTANLINSTPTNRYKFTDEDRRKGGESRKSYKCSIEDIFLGKVTYQQTHFKYRLVDEGYKEWVCENCNNSDWLGNPIPLELHHVDGDNKNNQLENLQFLCPNCHSLTNNYRWKKKFNC